MRRLSLSIIIIVYSVLDKKKQKTLQGCASCRGALLASRLSIGYRRTVGQCAQKKVNINIIYVSLTTFGIYLKKFMYILNLTSLTPKQKILAEILQCIMKIKEFVEALGVAKTFLNEQCLLTVYRNSNFKFGISSFYIC